jgi:hypothetical protein
MLPYCLLLLHSIGSMRGASSYVGLRLELYTRTPGHAAALKSNLPPPDGAFRIKSSLQPGSTGCSLAAERLGPHAHVV